MTANNLVKEDAELFDYMKNHYQSDNEREFFEKIRYKQEYVLTSSHDLILSEQNNEDRLYIVRCEYEEYIVGQEFIAEEQHVMCLYDALNLNLKKTGLLDKDITLFEWLRQRDYAGVEYGHNYDDI